MQPISAITVRQVLLLLVLGLLFGVLYWNLRFFVPALLGAYTLYVLLRTPLFFLTERWRWPKKLAALVLILLTLVLVFMPFNWIFGMLQGRVMALLQNSDSLLLNAEQVIKSIETRYKITLLTDENLRNVNNWALSKLRGVVDATLNGLGLLIALCFILWFMLMEGKKMEHSFFGWVPLRNQNVVYLRKNLNDLVWGNALGIPLMGIVQGFAGLLVYWLAGIENPWLWFGITFIAGMMPIVGASLAYVPLALILLADGEEWKALFIFIYGFLVIGSVDNVARMWLMKKINQTHPLITLFGAIAGLQMFGFIGFIFGPILISMFLLLLQVYQKEFHNP